MAAKRGGKLFDRIRALFSDSAAQADSDEPALHLAAAVLLIEVAKSDDNLDEEEILRLRGTLQRDWRLNEADLDGLVAFAHEVSNASASLQQHIDLINRNFSSARKIDLIRSLWQAAAADGEVHRNEELTIHRLAGLMNVSDAEVDRSKHWALGS